MNREDFIKYIEDKLSGSSFTKDPESTNWTNEWDRQMGGEVIVVNGQRMQQPGQLQHVKVALEFYGDGELREGDIVNGFIQMDATIKEGDDPEQPMIPTECLYYDDPSYFDMLMNKLFGI